jgi:hypothetical protein
LDLVDQWGAKVEPDEGFVVHLDPKREREQIEAHRVARQQQRPQQLGDGESPDNTWMWAVLAIAAIVAIVAAGYLLLVAGPGNPAAPQPCMPPICV